METQNRFYKTLEKLKEAKNYRVFPEISAAFIDLCSNDYLGLNRDKNIYSKFLNQLPDKGYKFSSCSSRLLDGNSIEHNNLESLISERYNAQACLLYNSGYHANLGILPALTNNKDLIIADKLVHASIIDGIKLSPAKLERFKHLDYTHLEKILIKSRSNHENVFIISESIFSMDGDIADLEKLVDLKNKYKAYLYVDEAHAVGTRGENGLGCVEEFNLIEQVDFIVGTFGKALASVGAFLICSKLFKEYLINHSRTLIYTTALPPINIAWTKYIFELLPDLKAKRENLRKISQEFAQLLKKKTQSNIIPLIIGSNEAAIAKSLFLKEHNYNVLPIRYPTVPEGTARLRFSLRADMNIDQLIPLQKLLSQNG